MSGTVITTTVRITSQTAEKMKKFCLATHVTQSAFFEAALNEYMENHQPLDHYVVRIHHGVVILLKRDGEKLIWVEDNPMNGLSPAKVAEKYAETLHAHVDLIEGEGT